jgi:hypothetical protein
MNRYTPTIVFLVLCLVICLINWNCSSTNQHGVEETHYPLIDTRLKVHKYKDNIQWMLFPKNNTKLTQYCSVHFEWEDITPVYRQINEEYKWVYQVKKNKKSFK